MTGMAKNMGRQKWIKESPACTYQKKLLEEISEERNRGVRTSWSASPHNIYNNRKKIKGEMEMQRRETCKTETRIFFSLHVCTCNTISYLTFSNCSSIMLFLLTHLVSSSYCICPASQTIVYRHPALKKACQKLKVSSLTLLPGKPGSR